jgi:hypothetical protein
MALDWPRLIAEHRDWEDYNFPGTTMIDDLMGVQEEVGELTHHHLKAKQSIRTNEDHIAEGQDAVGDIMIYLLGVMGHVERMSDGPHDVRHVTTDDAELLVLRQGIMMGLMHEACLSKRDERYRISIFIHNLRRYCKSVEWDFDRIVTLTWAKVKQRDWQKDPVKGVSAGAAIDLLREDDIGYEQDLAQG